MPRDRAQVYVRLLDEGTDVWRPVEASLLPSGAYRLVASTDVDPSEVWEFPAGSVVRCEMKTLEGSPTLVAVGVAGED